MSEVFNYCHVVSKSDIGRRRKANEDNMDKAVTQNGLVSVVCDGMGGHVGGATASRIAVNTIIEHLQSVYYDDPRVAIGEAIDRANQAILQQAAMQPELQGMGSTCVLLIVRGGKVYYGHVGDSRIYLVQSRRIKQLTTDHSYVQMLVDAGQLTKEQAEHHPRKNEITNALGIPNMQPATVAANPIVPSAGDCFVLCSDGLSGMVSDEVICKVVSRQAEMNAQDRVDHLVQLANDNGGVDNITVQMVEFSISPAAAEQAEKGNTLPPWLKIAAPVALAVILVGVGLYFYLRKPTPSAGEGQAPESGLVTSTVVKGDTTELTLGPVPYMKGKKLLELIITDKNITLQGEKEPLYTDNVKLNATTLKMENPAIEVKFNTNFPLFFTDKNPGKEVSFTLNLTDDATKVYRYRINIGSSNLSLGLPKDPKAPAAPATPVAPEEKKEKMEVEVLVVEFEYATLTKNDKLVLNYKEKPTFTFNGKESSLSRYIAKIDLQKISLSKGWRQSSGKEKRLELSATDVKEASQQYEFILPCTDREGTTFNVKIVLKKKEAPATEEEAPAASAPAPGQDTEEAPQGEEGHVEADGVITREL